MFGEVESQAVEALDLPGVFRTRSHSYVRAIQAGCSQDDDCLSVFSMSGPQGSIKSGAGESRLCVCLRAMATCRRQRCLRQKATSSGEALAQRSRAASVKPHVTSALNFNADSSFFSCHLFHQTLWRHFFPPKLCSSCAYCNTRHVHTLVDISVILKTPKTLKHTLFFCTMLFSFSIV